MAGEKNTGNVGRDCQWAGRIESGRRCVGADSLQLVTLTAAHHAKHHGASLYLDAIDVSRSQPGGNMRPGLRWNRV